MAPNSIWLVSSYESLSSGHIDSDTEVMWGCSKKATIYKPRTVALGETKTQHLISDFQLQDRWENETLLFEPPRPLLAVVMAALANYYTNISQLGSCVSSQTVNKYPFHGLFSQCFFHISFCALGYDVVFMISLFKMSPKSSWSAIWCSKAQKAVVMCLMEKIQVR